MVHKVSLSFRKSQTKYRLTTLVLCGFTILAHRGNLPQYFMFKYLVRYFKKSTSIYDDFHDGDERKMRNDRARALDYDDRLMMSGTVFANCSIAFAFRLGA